MPESHLCIQCRKRTALARAERCYICNKNAAAKMYRRWLKEQKKPK